MEEENYGAEFEDLISQRIGQDFDGECHLTEKEAVAVMELIRAARTVLVGLNARIEMADHSSVPVFDGMSDLSDALRAFEPEEVEA